MPWPIFQTVLLVFIGMTLHLECLVFYRIIFLSSWLPLSMTMTSMFNWISDPSTVQLNFSMYQPSFPNTSSTYHPLIQIKATIPFAHSFYLRFFVNSELHILLHTMSVYTWKNLDYRSSCLSSLVANRPSVPPADRKRR